MLNKRGERSRVILRQGETARRKVFRRFDQRRQISEKPRTGSGFRFEKCQQQLRSFCASGQRGVRAIVLKIAALPNQAVLARRRAVGSEIRPPRQPRRGAGFPRSFPGRAR